MDHPEKVSQVQSWDKKELLMPPEGSDQGTRWKSRKVVTEVKQEEVRSKEDLHFHSKHN